MSVWLLNFGSKSELMIILDKMRFRFRYTEITEIIVCTEPISTSSSSCRASPSITRSSFSSNRLGMLFSRILAVIIFISDKDFALAGTVQRGLEGNKRVGKSWEVPRPQMATEWRDTLHSRSECRSKGWYGRSLTLFALPS